MENKLLFKLNIGLINNKTKKYQIEKKYLLLFSFQYL